MKKTRITPVVLAAGIVLSTAARFFVITQHTEMTTGFLYHGDEPLWNSIYYGLILIAAVAAIFTARADAKKDSDAPITSAIGKVKTITIGLLTMAAAVFAAYEGMDEMRAFTPTLFRIISDFAFAVLLAIIAFVTLYNKNFTPVGGYLYSLIGAYCICRGMYCFMSRMAISTVPEYMIECLSLIGMAVYFVTLGRYLSGNSGKHTKKALGFWGVGTASLTFSSALAMLIAKLAAPEEISSRIVYTAAEAENYRQASAGFDAYKMVITPWVEILLGIIIVVSLVIAFSKPSEE